MLLRSFVINQKLPCWSWKSIKTLYFFRSFISCNPVPMRACYIVMWSIRQLNQPNSGVSIIIINTNKTYVRKPHNYPNSYHLSTIKKWENSKINECRDKFVCSIQHTNGGLAPCTNSKTQKQQRTLQSNANCGIKCVAIFREFQFDFWISQ